MKLSLQDEIAKEIFIRIAAERVNRNHFPTWSEIARQCLQVGTIFVDARKGLPPLPENLNDHSSNH